MSYRPHFEPEKCNGSYRAITLGVTSIAVDLAAADGLGQ